MTGNEQSKIQIGIVGAAGYTGVELMRLLSKHPQVELKMVCSREYAGKSVAAVFPFLQPHIDKPGNGEQTPLLFSQPKLKKLKNCALVFFATPHTVAMAMVPDLIKAKVKVIDLSADFRIKDAALWESWYNCEHVAKQLLKDAVYGLPELNREQIKTAQLIANPGCYPTASILALLPLAVKDLIVPQSIIIDAKSGVSGAGRGKNVHNLFAEIAESFRPYAVNSHRHMPEIAQVLSAAANCEHELTFVPHLVPMVRGIAVTAYLNLRQDDLDLQQIYADFYENEPFIQLLPPEKLPNTADVRGSNFVQIALAQNNAKRAIICAAEDNLQKGAAAQAVQNMNIMLEFDETTAIDNNPVWP